MNNKQEIHYEQLSNGHWNCDWWEGKYKYGAGGKTKEEALQNVIEAKEKGLAIQIDWSDEIDWQQITVHDQI